MEQLTALGVPADAAKQWCQLWAREDPHEDQGEWLTLYAWLQVFDRCRPATRARYWPWHGPFGGWLGTHPVVTPELAEALRTTALEAMWVG